MLSSLAPIYKGKGNPLNTNSFRGIKLLKHAFKFFEGILDKRPRKIVDIDKMQHGLMSGRGTVDIVFTLSSFLSVDKGCLQTRSNVCSAKSVFIAVSQMFHMESVLLLCLMSLFVYLVWA